MLRPKKNSYEEFDNEKNSCGTKIPPPHWLPHNLYVIGDRLSLLIFSIFHHAASLTKFNREM